MESGSGSGSGSGWGGRIWVGVGVGVGVGVRVEVEIRFGMESEVGERKRGIAITKSTRSIHHIARPITHDGGGR